MKKIKLLLLTLLILIAACNPTDPDPSGSDRAVLVLNNNHNESLFYKISDGGINDEVEYALSAKSSITTYWGMDHDVFSEEDGNIQITYYLLSGEGGVINHHLEIGTTDTYSFGGDNENFTIFNLTSGEVTILEIEGFSGPYFIGANSDLGFNFDIDFDTEIYLEFTGDHVFTGFDYITIAAYYNSEYEIEADAGAFKIVNSNPVVDLSEIYIAPNSSSSWGPNQIDFNLSPGGWGIWTVDEGLWDIQIVDENGGVTEFFGEYVNLDETSVVNYRSGSLKTKSDKVHDNGEDKKRVEFKRSN